MYMSSWDKWSLESYKEKCEKLEKENEKYIINFSSLYDNDRQYTKKIKEQDDLIDTMSDQLAELKNTIKIQQTTISELKECLRKKESENEHLNSKIVDFTTVQNLRAQVKELQSENEHLNLNLLVEELSKARALAEANLRERNELIFYQCKKMQFLEEHCEPFYEVPSEFDSEIVHDTQDNSEKDLILSLQTQVKKTIELVVRFSDEKYFALKEIESLKDEIKSLQIENQNLKSRESELNNLKKVYETKESVLLKDIDQMKSQVLELLKELQISNQEMKQQIILFEEDKRMFLTKNEFLEKVSSSVQKENNDLLASNDVLKQRLQTNSTIETKNLELVKEMGDKVKHFDDEKKAFEIKISRLEKVLAQRVKDFDDVKTELSRRTDKFETYFANLEK
ncbi:hypothetical protein Tco_0151091 [Tanacetum coccineum]